MGDMKTPDFDDLLAAFDIPDAPGLDAKEPIQEGPEEAVGQLKHPGMGLDEEAAGQLKHPGIGLDEKVAGQLKHPGIGLDEEATGQLKHPGIGLDDNLLNHPAASGDVPVVSVIVKNTSRQECLEDFGHRLHPGPVLQNGFLAPGVSGDLKESAHSGFPKSHVSPQNGEAGGEFLRKVSEQHISEGKSFFAQSFSQFSPISSPESEDTQGSRDDIHPKQQRLNFPEASGSVEPSLSDSPSKLSLSMFNSCSEDQSTPSNTHGRTASIQTECVATENVSKFNCSVQKAKLDFPDISSPENGNNFENNCSTVAKLHLSTSCPFSESQTSKLSSCLEALAALNSRTNPSEPNVASESSFNQNDPVNTSPKVPASSRSQLEAVKRKLRPSDSPVSICSDSSGKGSPAMASGSPAAIPKVRIKTIKTVSGQIKRTVTSVLPDSETEEVHSAYESSPSQSMISEDAYWVTSPSQSQNVARDGVTGISTKATLVHSTSSMVVPNRPEGHGKKPSVARPPSVLHNANVSAKMSVAHPRQKLKRMTSSQSVPAAGSNSLPKAMHLANLNLVPHSVAASVAARCASHQQSQPSLSSSTVYSTVPLVHQVKTTGAHQRPSAPSTAAGTLNRLLNNANPVPTYVPNLQPPPDSDIQLPARGFRCLECGDAFGVERSLVCHYSRRSVHIEVACTHCAKTLVFFNKCALLAHAREHKSKGRVMQCTQLCMKPIAEDQMFASLSAKSLVNTDQDALPVSLPKNQPAMPLYPDTVIRHRLCCLECKKQLADYQALAGHYQRLSDDPEGLTCKVCSMLLPNKCSFGAHQRIHAHKSPYCCPECGALSRSADIQKHVRENCLHYARKAWYKCLHCEMVFKTVQGQKSHVEERHCEVFYKCSLCPVAFKSSDGCELHISNKHSGSKTSPQIIFKCSCETVFKKKQLLLQHFYHNANKRTTCVFKCPECTSVLPQKQLLMQHFKNMHSTVFKVAGDQNRATVQTFRLPDAPSAPKAKVHSVSKRREVSSQKVAQRGSPPSWTCAECVQRFPDREAYVSHMKANHRRALKRFPCRQCEHSFNSSTGLRRHVRHDHDRKRKIYTCWYCTDTRTVFDACTTLKNHISLMHGIKNPDMNLMPKTAAQECNMGVAETSLSQRPASDRAVCGGVPEAPPPERRKAALRCSTCGFVAEDSTRFRRHILRHRAATGTPQCPRCGLCFTSPPALSRHLFIVHRVRGAEEEEDEERGKGKGKDRSGLEGH